MVARVANAKAFPLAKRPSTSNLVTKIAVDKEVAIPIRSVVANPLIGPVPNANKINAVRPVVMLASKIEASGI